MHAAACLLHLWHTAMDQPNLWENALFQWIFKIPNFIENSCTVWKIHRPYLFEGVI